MLGFVPEKYENVKPEVFRDILDKELHLKIVLLIGNLLHQVYYQK